MQKTFNRPRSTGSHGLLLSSMLLLALPSANSVTVPSGVVRSVTRGGAQIFSKFGFGGLRSNLNKIYQRREWTDAFDFVDLYQTYQENNTVPPELKRLANTAIAANNGDPVAQRQLGVAYQSGNKVRRDFKKASYWFSKAVEEKDGLSMIFLGRMFNRGQGVARSTVGAYCLFSLAARHGQAQLAQREIQAVKRRMSNTQLTDAQSCMK
jgi:TPR repeat protein